MNSSPLCKFSFFSFKITGLNRQLNCGSRKDREGSLGDCADRAACERLSNDAFEFPANGLARAADAFVLLSYGRSWREISSLMDYAAADECDVIGRCDLERIIDCIES